MLSCHFPAVSSMRGIVMKCFLPLFVWSPSWMKTLTLTSLSGPGKDYGCLFTLWWCIWYQNWCSLSKFLIPWPMQTWNSFCHGACYVAFAVPPPNIKAPIGYSNYFHRISLLFPNLPNLLLFHDLIPMSVFCGQFDWGICLRLHSWISWVNLGDQSSWDWEHLRNNDCLWAYHLPISSFFMCYFYPGFRVLSYPSKETISTLKFRCHIFRRGAFRWLNISVLVLLRYYAKIAFQLLLIL